MSEDDYGDTIPIRFVICEPPKPEEENKKERVPQKIPIHIFGKENDP